MILGLGVDLIEKERLAGWLDKPGAQRRFAAEELAHAARSGRPEESLAAAFALKEAFYKAAARLLPDIDGLMWRVALHRRDDGSPQAVPEPAVAELLHRRGVRRIHLSITHDRTQVLAIVLLESDAAAAHDPAAWVSAGFGVDAAGAAEEFIELDSRLAAGLLPLRQDESSKFDYGHVVIAGGSRDMPGAAQMAAEAALHGGAGLVTLTGFGDVLPLSPEVIRRRLSLDDVLGGINDFVQDDRYRRRVLAFGMGLGRDAAAADMARSLAGLPLPKVIDADGLNALAGHDVQPVDAVLTPHIGEMARLLGCDTAAVRADMAGAVRRCADKYGAVVVLKAHRTLITAPGQPIWRNNSGNPGMAGGGSGDVLAGLVAAWLAQGLEPLAAALLSVHLHGLAGDLAAADLTQYAMTAMSIVDHLPAAYQRLLAIKGQIEVEYSGK